VNTLPETLFLAVGQPKNVGTLNMEEKYSYLLDGLEVDTSGYWGEWDWKKVAPITSYNHARLEEYRDSVVVAYRLYNLIGLEHIRRLLIDVPREVKILDAGGGTGRKAIPLAEEGFTNITILDHAPGWLQFAKEKAEIVGVQDKFFFIESDVCDMGEIDDAYFDYVFAMGGVVSYCGDPGSAIREIGRVLKRGGKVIADGIHGRLGSMHLLSQMGALEYLEDIAYDKNPQGRQATFLPEDLKLLAVDNGFENVNIWSEFMFMPDDHMRIGENTIRWERVVIDLEMKYCEDPRFLGAGMLILCAEKK